MTQPSTTEDALLLKEFLRPPVQASPMWGP